MALIWVSCRTPLISIRGLSSQKLCSGFLKSLVRPPGNEEHMSSEKPSRQKQELGMGRVNVSPVREA